TGAIRQREGEAMFEVIGALFGFLLFLGFIACVFVMPLVALLRTRRIRELADRLEDVERELARLRRVAQAAAPEQAAAPGPAPAGRCVAGYVYHRRGWRVFSQMLTAGGVVLLYLAAYASFGYYHLLPRDRGAIFLVALVAEAFALAVLYEAPAIAVMAVVGG